MITARFEREKTFIKKEHRAKVKAIIVGKGCIQFGDFIKILGVSWRLLVFSGGLIKFPGVIKKSV